MSLYNYSKLNYPNSPRFGKLLILYADLRKYTSKVIEDIFFKDVIGKFELRKIMSEINTNINAMQNNP